VPTWVADGVPVSLPVVASNLAQEGVFVIENLSVVPVAPGTDGWKLYACPTFAVVAGDPWICIPATVSVAERSIGIEVLALAACAAEPSSPPHPVNIAHKPAVATIMAALPPNPKVIIPRYPV
jgi:hypothetical protein